METKNILKLKYSCIGMQLLVLKCSVTTTVCQVGFLSVGRKYIFVSIMCLDCTTGEYYMNLVTKLRSREPGRGRDNLANGRSCLYQR